MTLETNTAKSVTDPIRELVVNVFGEDEVAKLGTEEVVRLGKMYMVAYREGVESVEPIAPVIPISNKRRKI